MDVTVEDSVTTSMQSLEERLNIDVLINNARIMSCGITEVYTPEQISACRDMDVVGVARTCRAVLPRMRERKSGLMIYISSSSGRLAMPFFGLYCASKWALGALAEFMHYELASFGVESIIVEPGGHSTDLNQSPPAHSDTLCIDSYGDIAKAPANIVEMFQSVFSQGDKSTDAQNVADQLAELIDMEDERPIRRQWAITWALIRSMLKSRQYKRSSFLPMAGIEAQDKRLFVSATITLKPKHYEEGLAAIGPICASSVMSEPSKRTCAQKIHVAHFIIDDLIHSTDRGAPYDDSAITLNPDEIAKTYLYVSQQERSAWTWELELRTNAEIF